MKDAITFTYDSDNIYKHLEQFALNMALRIQHVNVEKLSKDINKMSKWYIKKLNVRGHRF